MLQLRPFQINFSRLHASNIHGRRYLKNSAEHLYHDIVTITWYFALTFNYFCAKCVLYIKSNAIRFWDGLNYISSIPGSYYSALQQDKWWYMPTSTWWNTKHIRLLKIKPLYPKSVRSAMPCIIPAWHFQIIIILFRMFLQIMFTSKVNMIL